MICSSWYIERDRVKLVILGHFLPFYTPKILKNQTFEKMKKPVIWLPNEQLWAII